MANIQPYLHKLILKYFVDIIQLEYTTLFLSLDEMFVYLRIKVKVNLNIYKVGQTILE